MQYHTYNFVMNFKDGPMLVQKLQSLAKNLTIAVDGRIQPQRVIVHTWSGHGDSNNIAWWDQERNRATTICNRVTNPARALRVGVAVRCLVPFPSSNRTLSNTTSISAIWSRRGKLFNRGRPSSSNQLSRHSKKAATL